MYLMVFPKIEVQIIQVKVQTVLSHPWRLGVSSRKSSTSEEVLQSRSLKDEALDQIIQVASRMVVVISLVISFSMAIEHGHRNN